MMKTKKKREKKTLSTSDIESRSCSSSCLNGEKNGSENEIDVAFTFEN